MIQIELSNPSFESCIKCIHSDDSEETCILRRCIHAVAQLKECYVPKQPTIEERKKGEWIERNPQNSDTCRLIECDQCGFSHIVGFNVPYEHWIENRNFCERCGADMRKGEGEK